MSKYLSMVIVLLALNAQAANTTEDAINSYFNNENAPCIRIEKWPVTVTKPEIDMSKVPNSSGGKMVALEKIGLVQSQEKGNEKIYQLTDKSKPFMNNGKLCYAKRTIKGVTYTDSKENSNEKGVRYSYNFSSLADWAKDQNILAAFPYIKQDLSGEDKSTSFLVLVKGSSGWKVKGTK